MLRSLQFLAIESREYLNNDIQNCLLASSNSYLFYLLSQDENLTENLPYSTDQAGRAVGIFEARGKCKKLVFLTVCCSLFHFLARINRLNVELVKLKCEFWKKFAQIDLKTG